MDMLVRLPLFRCPKDKDVHSTIGSSPPAARKSVRYLLFHRIRDDIEVQIWRAGGNTNIWPDILGLLDGFPATNDFSKNLSVFPELMISS